MTRKNQPVRSFEHLEARHMMAGDVNVSVLSGYLLVTGDNSSNSLHATEVSGRRWKITGLDGTKINGKTHVISAAVKNDVQFIMNGGHDRVTIANAFVPRILGVFVDRGNNKVKIENVNVGYGLGVIGTNGNNSVVIRNLSVQTISNTYFSIVQFDSGNNTIDIDRLRAIDFRVHTGGGKDRVTITHSTLRSVSYLAIYTGDGRDVVSLSKVRTTALFVEVGGGSRDSVRCVNSTVATATFANSGGSNGSLVLAGNRFGSLTILPTFLTPGIYVVEPNSPAATTTVAVA